MSLIVRDLLAEPGLGLRLVSGDAEALDGPVNWVSVTELPDPRPWLNGSELVLTTGLRQRGAPAQRQFVRRLAERRIAALGWAVGLTHAEVPAATVEEARRHGMVVVEVPFETPFMAVDRFVADRILEAHYGRFRDLLGKYDVLARALLSGSGLSALVASLHAMVGAPVMVVDRQGAILASSPARAAWPIEQILRSPGTAAADTGLTVVPVDVENSVVAHLVTRRPDHDQDVLPYAVALVGLELARVQAVLAGRRQLAGQVIEDLVRGAIPAADAERRLAAFGIQPDRPHAVLLASVPDASRGQALAGDPLPEVLTAVVEGNLVAVLAEGQPAHEAAHLMLGHLRGAAGSPRVGIGGWYAGVSGLRWSYYEAHEAMTRGPGVNEREPMSLSGLILASEDVPIGDLARDLLRPLSEFDAEHGSALVDTLRAFLDADGSVAAVAEGLILHRNTVRYRLAQIERLTGRSLASTADRVQLWLALAAVRLSRDP